VTRRFRRLATITAVLAALLFGVTTLISPAPAAQAAVNVPNWIAKYLLSSRGEDGARHTFEDQGYKCLPTGLVCYIEGSYDPPRWGRGNVMTGGPGTYLNARAWPGTDAPVVRTFPDRWRLVIFCQTRGPVVNGRWGPTNIWNYVGRYGDRPMFVSDGFVYTGSNGYVAGDCASTNYGG
jgi:hypothetical protein